MPEYITKEDIKVMIQQYADSNPGPNNVIKNSLGTDGTSWTGEYKDGMLAICEGISRAVNEKVAMRLKNHRDSVKSLRDKLNSMKAHYNASLYFIQSYVNWCIVTINTLHGKNKETLLLGRFDDDNPLPDIPEI